MEISEIELQNDIQRVNQISIIPLLLDVICQTTGMGFAAVARVTETRWITCTVRDDIQFGLKPGSELNIATTICNEIRDSVKPVVIDHVSEDTLFCNHHTPALYGFQSYISYPIILKTGEFFGTLCAIDPHPRNLKDSPATGLFTAFADLISFHLKQVELLEQSGHAVKMLNQQLTNSLDENRQFRHISGHTLQEPLRKLRVFSGMLHDALQINDIEKAKLLANRVNRGAERFSSLISDLSGFSSLSGSDLVSASTDLSEIIALVVNAMKTELDAKSAIVDIQELPVIPSIPGQMHRLFSHLFHNAVKFARKNTPLLISVTAKEYTPASTESLNPEKKYTEIIVTDNGIGIQEAQLEKIFDIFSQLPSEMPLTGAGIGLSICRKIVRNHFGEIMIRSKNGMGTSVSVILPL